MEKGGKTCQELIHTFAEESGSRNKLDFLSKLKIYRPTFKLNDGSNMPLYINEKIKIFMLVKTFVIVNEMKLTLLRF